MDHPRAGVSLSCGEQGSEMRAAGGEHGAVGLKMTTAHHDDAVTQLSMQPLEVQLLKDLLKVPWEIHDLRRN